MTVTRATSHPYQSLLHSSLYLYILQAFSQYLDIQKIKLGKVVQDAVNSDIVHERVSAEQLRLYRCSDAEGVLKITEVKGGPLLQTDLNSDVCFRTSEPGEPGLFDKKYDCILALQDSFIVDNRSNGIWVWIGKNATKTERSEAMRNAQVSIRLSCGFGQLFLSEKRIILIWRNS